jgi:hypothetical protein
MNFKRISIALLPIAAAALVLDVLTASPPANADNPVPAAPSNVTATEISPTSVQVTWTNNAANQSGVVISRDGVVSVDLQGATVSSYIWSGLSPETNYYFWVASKIYGTPGEPLGYGNTQSAWMGPAHVFTFVNDLTIAAPADITANATSPSGATLNYPLPAVADPDDSTGPTPDCSPGPESVFPIGATTVTCAATDANDSNAPVATSFTITVKGAAEQVADLYQAVQGVGAGTSLAGKITQDQAYLAAGDPIDAWFTLGAFINEVTAQSGKHIPAGQAAQLIADAQRIQAVMNPMLGVVGPPVFNDKYSGYATTFEHAYYDASATWTVPANNCNPLISPFPFSVASQWVGLGGIGDSTHPETPLVQAGVVSACISGLQVNLLVWEVLPPDTSAHYVLGYLVNAGDRMSASVNYLGGDMYSMSVTDKTQGWSWSQPVSTGSNQVPTTADWIVESNAKNLADTADFGRVTFAQASYSTATTHHVLLGSPDSVHTAPLEVVTGSQQMTTVSPIAPPGTFTVTYIPQ